MDQEMDFSLDEALEGELPQERFEDKLIWFLKGFIYPLWNRPYYKKATQKRMWPALLFLLGFAILQTGIASTTAAINLARFGRDIDTAYQSGEIPEIRIENGIAVVSGTGSYQIENNRQFIGIDTTGEIREIDTSRFSEGILLTRTELHLVNEDGYQVLPLSDLNNTLGNPITLDGPSISRLWSGVALFVNIAVIVGGFLFYSFGRFIYLVLLGLLVWAAVSLSRKKVDFAPILITGIYANVPATYILFTLRKIGATFFGLRAIVLLIIWGLVISYVLNEEPIPVDPESRPGTIT
jgi:hypothetical protein